MTKLERLSHILGVVFDPRFWIRNHEISDFWSDKLEQLMDDNTPVSIGPHGFTAEFSDGRTIWFGNWPFAFGRPYAPLREILPRRRTAIRLRKYIQEYSL